LWTLVMVGLYVHAGADRADRAGAQPAGVPAVWTTIIVIGVLSNGLGCAGSGADADRRSPGDDVDGVLRLPLLVSDSARMLAFVGA
jgi:hypothetical protein